MFARLLCPLIKQRKIEVILYSALRNTIRNKSTKTALTESKHTQLDTNVKPIGERVKETTKTAYYVGIILLGVGVTGTLFYAIFNELFSSRSPNNIYAAAVKKCLQDYRIEDKLGLPITAYGEETRRGRRQHPNYIGFLDQNGRKHIRMQFYLKGAFFKATATLEKIEDDRGNFDYLYLIVNVDDSLRTRIVIEDNRNKTYETSELFA